MHGGLGHGAFFIYFSASSRAIVIIIILLLCFNTLGIIGYYSQWQFVMINDKLLDNHIIIMGPVVVVPMWIEIQYDHYYSASPYSVYRFPPV